MAMPARSWLFAPGHSEKLLGKVFDAGADAVVLDLEDGVPPDKKDRARELVAEVLEERRAWVRINRPGSAAAAADLRAVGEIAAGIRVPKVESPADVAWVSERALDIPLACTIETALGVVTAGAIASSPSVQCLVFGAADLALDARLGTGFEPLIYARSHVVIASRAAGIAAPIDGAYTGPDGDGLRDAVQHARSLGFGGKSAVRPHQVPVINEVFSPDASELAWAREVLAAFEGSGGGATRLADGALIDEAVAARARWIVEQRRR